jgi:hypothetical protein
MLIASSPAARPPLLGIDPGVLLRLILIVDAIVVPLYKKPNLTAMPIYTLRFFVQN